VDIIGAIKGTPVVDLFLLIGLGVFFFLGFLQGAIRRLLGIASIVIAFLIAGNMRDPAGDFLSNNWHQFSNDYNKLLAFVIVFAVVAVAATILIQGFYKRTDISAEHPIVDDIVGGLLGLLQGFVLLLFIVIILSSFPLPPAKPGDVSQLRDAQELLNQSHIGGWIRDTIAPIAVHMVGPLLPSDLAALFP
jgi:uncharacterized membrane protein required for colicin V production